MTPVTKFCAVFLSSLFVGFLMASEGTDGVRIELQANDLAVVQAGENIYQAQCAACHGARLEGQPDWRSRDDNGFLPAPPHDATGHTWHHADDLLFEIVKYGPAVVINDDNYKTTMPVYKDILSDKEIIAVLSFIKNTWPEEERSWQEKVNGTPRDIFEATPKKESSILDKLLK